MSGQSAIYDDCLSGDIPGVVRGKKGNGSCHIFRFTQIRCGTLPQKDVAVNQMECNPFFQQKELRKYMEQYGIRLEAWYPLGHADKELLSDVRLSKIAGKYGKSVVQVILRWHLQEGIVAIPKATSMEHIRENLDIFDFMLTDDEMAQIREMDKGIGTHDPEDMENAVRLSSLKVHD